MSYILDALRRADAERERGRSAVPGLHSANLAPAAGDAPLAPPPGSGRGLALAAVALGLLALLVFVWWLGRASAPAPQAMAPPAPPLLATAPAPVLSAPTVVVAAPPAPAAPPSAPAAAPAPTPAPLSETAAVPEAARAVPLARLTPEQRQAFPALSLGGSVWSDSPANRFVIANGQVVREGEGAAPGVTVERIEPRAVIVRWRDLRVELPL